MGVKTLERSVYKMKYQASWNPWVYQGHRIPPFCTRYSVSRSTTGKCIDRKVFLCILKAKFQLHLRQVKVRTSHFIGWGRTICGDYTFEQATSLVKGKYLWLRAFQQATSLVKGERFVKNTFEQAICTLLFKEQIHSIKPCTPLVKEETIVKSTFDQVIPLVKEEPIVTCTFDQTTS